MPPVEPRRQDEPRPHAGPRVQVELRAQTEPRPPTELGHLEEQRGRRVSQPGHQHAFSGGPYSGNGGGYATSQSYGGGYGQHVPYFQTQAPYNQGQHYPQGHYKPYHHGGWNDYNHSSGSANAQGGSGSDGAAGAKPGGAGNAGKGGAGGKW
ncbi:uncharacterized protein MELLADRAFT_113914 [Melampsora larici-populina 98AG31]|uniref:Uncharacterized protein n=1 Tax=Melampsora larici-populina (strain 98AG31 / pathotype 3-4-7) TaxID=747676 RepID=F4SBF9_MELLP|nr:uncharacterized protein MELLADRAFT_113914 [Melampsora larici-populina 98AG31]EGF98024.1 hypothetical protein MELLADRAFT_113914 [Melampsora larici-populina 98AG31]